MLPVYFSTVSSKGQIIIPAKIRKHLGITKGTEVTFLMDGLSIILKVSQRIRKLRCASKMKCLYCGKRRILPDGLYCRYCHPK